MINFTTKNVVILGAGRSGTAAAELLLANGATILLYDNNEKLNKNKKLIAELRDKKINYEFNTEAVKDSAWDFCVLSPGISDKSPLLKNIRGIVPIISEIELASLFTNTPIIAITGSNGKSTVTTLIEKILIHDGFHAIACGNIGYSFSRAVLENSDKDTIYVVEVSSFQLEHISKFSPDTSVILNITPDHLDRYPSFADYRDTKLNILSKQIADHRAVLNVDDKNIRNYYNTRASIVPVSVYKKSTQECWIDNEELKFTFNAKEYALPFSKILLPGPHNQSNIMHAVSAVLPYLKSAESVIATLKTFSGIEHRIEYCGKLKDISCYNDSKATNLDSVQAALKSFPENIHLIMGGRDKKGEFQLIETYADHIKTAYLIGEAADSIQSQIPKIETQICNTMENAIDSALNNFVKGDILLLSPGCASFDQYANFEERGRHFKQLIKAKK